MRDVLLRLIPADLPAVESKKRTGLLLVAGMTYAWTGVAVMWAFWISFVIFLASPRQLASEWPLPMVDYGGTVDRLDLSALIDLGLIGLFGLQHSLMARPWFKRWWASAIPEAFERVTFVHLANLALFLLIFFWQPIPIEVWKAPSEFSDAIWAIFASAWIVLFAGACSYGIFDLLGLSGMRRWRDGRRPAPPRLKTGRLYAWLRHPMYVGVLLGVWVTPRMTLGHLLLAAGLTGYVLIAVRHEERDLACQFGALYERWRLGYRA